MADLDRVTRREFICIATTAAGAALMPGVGAASPAQYAVPTAVAKSAQWSSREKMAWKVQPFPLSQVRLRKGPFLDAMEADRRYLHLLPSDRLLHTFRLNAGLASSAQPWVAGRSLTLKCVATSPEAITFPPAP